MRIATSTYFNSALAAIENQRASVSALNSQLATGRSVNQPSDDPVAFTNAQSLGSRVTALAQYKTDNAQLSADLGLGSQTLNQILNVVNSVTAIAVQAANSTTNAQNRTALAGQVTSLQSELLGLANSQNGNGVYLFGGSRGSVTPFLQQPDGSVAYAGDDAVQSTHTAQNQTAASLLDGGVLAQSLDGNGYAALSASDGNTGSATATLDGVSSTPAATAFRESATPYTIAFATVSGQLGYTVTRGGATVSSGVYAPGLSLTLSGMDVAFAGEPAAGDTFTLSPSQPLGVFDTLQQLIGALNQPVGTAATNALNTQRMNGVLADLSQATTGILSLQSKVGVTMRALNDANNANANESNADQSATTSDVAADVPAVMTAIAEQTDSLNAAMTAFGRLSQLTLFNYIQP